MRLRYYLEKIKMSQQNLADILGLPRNTVWRWCNNRATPNGKMLQRVSEVLGVSVDEILNGAETEHWTLEVRAGGKEAVNMNNSFGCVSSVSCGADGATLTLGGKYETFMSDEKFESLIAQLWAARELVVETGEKMKIINKAKKGD